jgi:hypothetical protein
MLIIYIFAVKKIHKNEKQTYFILIHTY